jgi:hypothetical protein
LAFPHKDPLVDIAIMKAALRRKKKTERIDTRVRFRFKYVEGTSTRLTLVRR